MPRHCVRRRLALLMAGSFVLALAGSLAACGGSSGDDPPPVAPAEQPAAAATTLAAETVPASAATPEPPVKSPTQDLPTRPAEDTPPAIAMPEPLAEPDESSTADPSPPPAEATDPETTPPPSSSPAPHPGVALIELAPGAFEHRTFATGERIEWTHGIFVLDPETGETEGYRALAASDERYLYYSSLPGGWVGIPVWNDREPSMLLLDRATGQSWRWPSDHLRLVAASREHLLFEEDVRYGDGRATRRFTIVNRTMEAVGHFAFAIQAGGGHAAFSPDGRTIVVDAGDTVYRVPVASAQPAVLLGVDATARRWAVWLARDNGPGIRVGAGYRNADGEGRTEWHSFSWEGALLPSAPCHNQISSDGYYAARISPDGRYVAWLVGGPVEGRHYGVYSRADPWPSIVIADAATCAPLFRVRSAYPYELAWRADWLSNSEGFVIGARDGNYLIARVHPTPALVALPRRGAGPTNPTGTGGPSHDFFSITVPRAGPESAPSGDGRYFGYGPGVYDAVTDRWVGPAIDPASSANWGWGASHRERWFGLFNDGHGWVRWLLLPPKIEFPPFSDEIAFRVAGTGSCLRLREAPGKESETKDCLPDGARLVLTEPQERARIAPHPAVAIDALVEGGESPTWVHVRSADGAEGWVSHDYLEHD